MDMEEPNAATAHGDLADVVARANAMPLPAGASTHHPPPPPPPPPPPAPATAAHMSAPQYHHHYYPAAQIMSPYDDERRPMLEAPSTVDPYLPPPSAMAPRAAYGLPHHHQLAAQISPHACCAQDALIAGFGPADDAEDAMRISPLSPAAHHQMIKRKNEVKKVVCIPAPPATSGRAGGGEVIPSDLWAWRKYGQKPIKGSPYPRGYYRCSSSKGCMARKQVERSRSDPNMLVVTYTAEHNHPWPMQRNVLAGYARAHAHAAPNTKNKQHKRHSDAGSGCSSSNMVPNYYSAAASSEQNAIGFAGDLDGLQASMSAEAVAGGGGGEGGGLMYVPACHGIHPDEVFAELEELEPAADSSMNTNNANIYSKQGVSYDQIQWHNKF